MYRPCLATLTLGMRLLGCDSSQPEEVHCEGQTYNVDRQSLCSVESQKLSMSSLCIKIEMMR